jgi:hypothetical protein
MVWLNPDDLRSMGVTMTGSPAQVSRAQRAGHFDSGERGKSSRKSISAAKPTRQWAPSLFNPICQPQLKACTMALSANMGE